jgi:hypothetical protein
MLLNNRINILFIVFSILYIASSCSIIDRESIVYPKLISTILNCITFLSSVFILYFFKVGKKITKEIGSSYLLFIVFYLSCFVYFVSYCYVMFA